MGVLAFWLIAAIVVAIAADARGRSGIGWFVIAVFLSPLIGLVLVLVIPNLKIERTLAAGAALQRRNSPPPMPVAAFGGKADRITVDRSPRPFEPDGVFNGVPYRVADDGSIHAIMQESIVRFRDFDKFTGALE